MDRCVPAKPANQFRSADRLVLRVMRRSGWWLVVALLAEAAGAAATLWMPQVLASAVDDTLQQREPMSALARLGGVLAVEVVAGLLAIMAAARMASDATAWLRRRLLVHVLGLGITGQRRFSAGGLTTRLISDVGPVTAIGPAVVGTLGGVGTAVGGVVGLWLIDWWLAVALGTGLPLAWLIVRVLVKDFSGLFVQYSRILAEIADRLAAALGGIRTIQALGTVDRETQRVLRPLPELARAGHEMWQTQRRACFQLGMVTPLIWVGVLALAGFSIAAGRISPGQFVAAGIYAGLTFGLLNQVESLLDLVHARAGAARVSEVLGEEPPVPGQASLPPGPGELTLRGVTIRVDGEVVLDQVDLRVPPGVAVALVGAERSGKSTLAMVAGGLIVPDCGGVLLDSVELRSVAPAELPRAVAYAFAQPTLLGETVAHAIGYGCPDAGRQEVERAARIAHADGFVQRLPHGYDTPLADAPMSGGEAQRLGLARAIACNARLTVFDDATSSLDVATELLVSTTITEQMGSRTRIVVTHRASTAARTDLVAWVEDGRVRAVAPHAHLWRLPAYRAVFGHGDEARAGAVS